MTSIEKKLIACKKCNAFCCTQIKPPVLKSERQIIIKSGYEDCFKKIDDDLYEIISKKDNECPYLDSNKSCKIHKIKPIFCRIWPVIPRLKNNNFEFIIIKCPIYSYMTKNEIQDAIKDTKNIPKKAIKYLWEISDEAKQKYKKFEYFRCSEF